MTSEWWLDERAHAGAEHLDADYVATYDAKAGFDPSAEVARLVAAGLGPGTTLVDLGAGTGVFAAAAVATGAAVIAVDVSPAMVDEMENRFDASTSSIGVVEAGFLSYEHSGPPADFVFSRNALHQLPDFWKVVALDRIASFVRPNGVLRLLDLAFDLEPAGVGEGVEHWMRGAVEDPAHGFTADDYAEHLRSEHSTFTWLLEPMIERAGFDIVERDTWRGAYAAYTCRRR